jgi:hypothetical protein
VVDGSLYNRQWQAVWEARTHITEEGWTAELAVPWASLRYMPGTTRIRANFHRIARRENELSGWVLWPRTQNPYRMDFAGWIDGLQTPPPESGLWLRPFGVASTTRTSAGATQTGDIGGEVLWQPSSNTIIEGTINTDFAQADVDRQVVNLRRFSVFFPEQRQFFLDSASLFDVGTTDDLVIQPFFSRRIGLSASGEAIPIDGGVRAVRSTSRGAVGTMAVHQQEGDRLAATTFFVGRLNRNLGPARRLGGLVTARREAATSTGTAALDTFVRLSPTLTVEGMVTATAGDQSRHGLAGHAKVARQTNQSTVSFLEAIVTRDYAPASGFVSRTNVALHAPYLSYDWRPRWRPRRVRNFKLVGYSYVYTALDDGGLEESFSEAWFDVIAQDGALFFVDVQHYSQRLRQIFEPISGIVIPPGHYSYTRPNIYYGSDRSRRAWYTARFYTGAFYDRRLDQAELRAFLSPSPRASVGLNVNINRFHGGRESATTRLVSPEIRLAWNPRVQLTTFYQYNDAVGQGTFNTRFSWEYRPLSFLYVILNGVRGVAGLAPVGPRRQQLLLKLAYFGHL